MLKKMQSVLIVFFFLFVGIMGIRAFNSPQRKALEKIKNLPEVQNYLAQVPQGRVALDHEDTVSRFIQVYEVIDGHTATFNWYEVDKNTGNFTRMFNDNLN